MQCFECSEARRLMEAIGKSALVGRLVLGSQFFLGKRREKHTPEYLQALSFIFRRYLNVYECPCSLVFSSRYSLFFDQYYLSFSAHDLATDLVTLIMLFVYCRRPSRGVQHTLQQGFLHPAPSIISSPSPPTLAESTLHSTSLRHLPSHQVPLHTLLLPPRQPLHIPIRILLRNLLAQAHFYCTRVTFR